MTSPEYDFTTREEIDAFLPGSVMMELTGFVEAIEPLRRAKTNQKCVLTVRLNNAGGKKINVVFWEENALHWNPKLKHNDILQVDGGTIGEVNLNYYKGQQRNLHSSDFHVQKESNVSVLGCYDTRNRRLRPIDTYTESIIKDVLSVKGAVGVTAFLKTEFRSTRTTPNGHHACGVLADDLHILCVEIEDFQATEKLVRGTRVMMVGHIVTTKPGAPLLEVKNMKNVYMDESHPILENAKLKLAIKPPLSGPEKIQPLKRSTDHDDQNEGNDDKKMKVD